MEQTDKIVNNGNWFIVEIIEQTETVAADESKENRRLTVRGNYLLIKSASLAKAYDKAEIIGQNYNYIFRNEDGIDLKNSFVGIGDLLPIYEDLEDGAEILWADYGSISARKARSYVKPRAEWLALRNTKKGPDSI
jgi:hypothetical protein